MLLLTKGLWVWLCVVLFLQITSAQHIGLVRRQDDATAASKTSDLATKTTAITSSTGGTNAAMSKNTEAASTTIQDSLSSITDGPSGASSMPTASSTIEAITTQSSDNSTFFNTPIPDGQLPLTPELTPGWGVAGVLLLTTGVIYTLVGIRNRWIHTFFSAAYLGAVSVTILVVYMMNVPVGNALQGGYVAAVVISGCALGAASTFFKELTEGLGCAVGGFCMSMWLLTLVPGGLLQNVPSKAIFIACFTIAAFAFSFSRWTRDWALMVTMSFAGATAMVLGIDCFSRAGLKEFWSYVWDLNEALFPLGATTYPVTKGIRVETAAVIIFFLFGIVSQIKLWRIVRDKREQRAADRKEARRDLEQEEARLGEQLEQENAEDRRQWERVYGDGEVGSSTAHSEGDDGQHEKRLRNSHVSSAKRQSGVEAIEMTALQGEGQQRPVPDPLMTTEEGEDGKVTIRVAADDIPEQPVHGDEITNEKAPDAELHRASTVIEGKRASLRSRVSHVPDIVPLPFTVPNADDDAASVSERSSVATFADDVEAQPQASPRRQSLAKRFSQGSMSLLRSMSQRSGRGAADLSAGQGESSDDLVGTRRSRPLDADGSVAATMDHESLSGCDSQSDRSHGHAPTQSIEVNAQLSPQLSQDSPAAAGTAQTVNSQRGIVDLSVRDGVTSNSPQLQADEMKPAPSDHQQSASSVISASASLTKDRLPRSLSRVAMSYRTNEWAKHLSSAETPAPDELKIAQAAIAAKTSGESAVPVNVQDLQRTAEDGAPLPAAPMERSNSMMSQLSNTRVLPRSGSRTAAMSSANLQTHIGVSSEKEPPNRSPTGTTFAMIQRRSSQASMGAPRRTSWGIQPIVEENLDNTASTMPPLPEINGRLSMSRSPPPDFSRVASPGPVPGVVSYTSPQTLLGQREMALRSRSSGNLLAGTLTPDPPVNLSRAPSEAGSFYNYPMYAAALNAMPDDVPLNQRRQFLRQNSMMAMSASNPNLGHNHTTDSDGMGFDSHQPQRTSTLPSSLSRASQLASFRQSVADDLRAGSPMITKSGRETPFSSTNNLLVGGRETEVQRNIDVQRNWILNQKDAEAQRLEIQRQNKEFVDRSFDERMRSGDMLEAHREAMRKMQRSAQ